MLKSLLIANRGEIACRIIRTARQLGVRAVAVYSDADRHALHVRMADEAVHIGPSPARESYLVGDRIIEAAKARGAEGIHPGYGFLSENADFAQAVIDAGLIWVGPKPDSIRAMGLKDAAKKLMIAAGVPVTPGYLGEDQSPKKLKAEADAMHYPILIKAVAGGGGKGMRRVEAAADFIDALDSCKREAASSFGDDRVILEKYILSPRHIEVQVFGDSHGNVVHLFERDCSLQRRHQKVIEEAPAPGMDDQLGDHRVIIGRNRISLLNAALDPPLFAEVKMVEPPNARQEPLRRVLGVKPRLDRVAGNAELVLLLRQLFAARNAQLPFDQIDPGDFLGHRMLDLQPSVHFHEPGPVGLEAL